MRAYLGWFYFILGVVGPVLLAIAYERWHDRRYPAVEGAGEADRVEALEYGRSVRLLRKVNDR